MDNSKLTDEQISLMIADFLEPNPELTDDSFCAELPEWIDDHDGDFYDSKVAWIFVYRGNDAWERFPLDFVRDPAMTMMLMGELARRSVETSILCSSSLFTMYTAGVETRWTARSMTELGRCIAEAFVLANNLGLEVKP